MSANRRGSRARGSPLAPLLDLVSVVLAGVALVGALASLACRGTEAVSSPSATAEEPLMVVETARVQRGPIVSRVVVSGSLMARRTSQIGARLPGRIARLHVHVGDRVAEGDLLFEIESGGHAAVLSQARAGLDVALAERHQMAEDLAAQEKLLEDELVAEQRVAHLRTKLEVARARERQAAQAVEIAQRDLADATVRAPSGELIHLSNLATPRITTGPVQIDRRDRARVVTLHGNVVLGKPLGEAAAEVDGFIADLDLPQGYSIEATGQTENMKETVDAVLFALGLGLLATYMILAAQFNDFLHPLAIMLCAPLSLVGAFAALAIAGKTLEMMTQIGFLMLMGLVMKNGILLVDYINQLRGRGFSLREAVLEAGPTRLRPVLMTTFSTVFGMIPLATMGGEGAEFRGAMGIIVIGGLLASMFLTLLVVPVAYTLIESGRTATGAGLARLWK